MNVLRGGDDVRCFNSDDDVPTSDSDVRYSTLIPLPMSNVLRGGDDVR